MKLDKNIIERLDQLIRLKATGCPADLAKKLNLSERTIYRIIKELKEIGCPISYDNERKSYYYDYEGRLVFCFISRVSEKHKK